MVEIHITPTNLLIKAANRGAHALRSDQDDVDVAAELLSGALLPVPVSQHKRGNRCIQIKLTRWPRRKPWERPRVAPFLSSGSAAIPRQLLPGE
jgi:hypothetical protein